MQLTASSADHIAEVATLLQPLLQPTEVAKAEGAFATFG